jgi:hypothetical protein
MTNETPIDFLQVQFALAQVDIIKTRLRKEGIFDFYPNEEYKKAVNRYEDLYDLYEEQKAKRTK